jgi:hypothetical protein
VRAISTNRACCSSGVGVGFGSRLVMCDSIADLQR